MGHSNEMVTLWSGEAFSERRPIFSMLKGIVTWGCVLWDIEAVMWGRVLWDIEAVMWGRVLWDIEAVVWGRVLWDIEAVVWGRVLWDIEAVVWGRVLWDIEAVMWGRVLWDIEAVRWGRVLWDIEAVMWGRVLWDIEAAYLHLTTFLIIIYKSYIFRYINQSNMLFFYHNILKIYRWCIPPILVNGIYWKCFEELEVLGCLTSHSGS